ncbi:MAG: hypothetical protein U0228_36250 [Myxococcaceae bacterium]
MSGRELTFVEKTFLKVARSSAGFVVGYNVAFDEELLKQHGISGLIKWGRMMMATFEEIEKQFGTRKAHVLAAFSSFFNGCDYCAWGHLFATGLVHFEATGKLFPIDEVETHDLMRLGDNTVLAELEKRLGGEFADDLRLIKRQYEIRYTPGFKAENEEDRLILKSIGLFEWVNECSITVSAPAPPMSRLAQKTKLLEAYAAARQPERAARASQKKG